MSAELFWIVSYMRGSMLRAHLHSIPGPHASTPLNEVRTAVTVCIRTPSPPEHARPVTASHHTHTHAETRTNAGYYRRSGGVSLPNLEIGFGSVRLRCDALRCEAVCAREEEEILLAGVSRSAWGSGMRGVRMIPRDSK